MGCKKSPEFINYGFAKFPQIISKESKMKMTQGHRMMITTHFHDSAVWPPRPLIFSMLDVVWFLFTVWCNRKGVIWFRRRHWGNEGNSTYKWPPGKQNINKHTFALTSCLLIPWVFNSRNSIKGCEIFRPNCLCMHPILPVDCAKFCDLVQTAANHYPKCKWKVSWLKK